nr:meiosis-specific topoisomerase [Pseudozyma flocculosa]
MASDTATVLARIDELMIDLVRQLATQAQLLTQPAPHTSTPSHATAERRAKRTRQAPQVTPVKLLTFASTDDGKGESNISFPTKSVVGMRRFARPCIPSLHVSVHVLKSLLNSDIFYQSLHLFSTQQASDRIVTQLLALLQCTRFELNIVASPRGLFCGALTIRSPASALECLAAQPTLIPPEIAGEGARWSVDLHCAGCCAGHTLLLVEKEAVFKHLLQVGVGQGQEGKWDGWVMLTAKGYPDHASRRLVQLVCAACEVRVVGLFDGDPYGVDIYRHFSHAARIEWIGIDVQDFLRVPTTLVPLRNDERSTAVRLLRSLTDSPDDVRMRLTTILLTGYKVEIEAAYDFTPPSSGLGEPSGLAGYIEYKLRRP